MEQQQHHQIEMRKQYQIQTGQHHQIQMDQQFAGIMELIWSCTVKPNNLMPQRMWLSVLESCAPYN
eukprot:13692733-Ditylum_brightwellii.AAC.1